MVNHGPFRSDFPLGGHMYHGMTVIQNETDALQEYLRDRSAQAFARIVSLHGDWVYSAARRMVRDADLAQDVTQAVFILLWQHPERAVGRPLGGWLFRVTRYCAWEARRSENRRENRERRAALMRSQHLEHNESSDSDQELWNQISPVLDDSVSQLRQVDRQFILLRFYQRKKLAEIGAAFNISEGAAQKRLAKAIEKLRLSLASKGVTAPTAGLSAILAAQTTQFMHPAPTALAAPVQPSSHGLAIAKGAVKIMFWNKMKMLGAATMAMILASSAVVALWHYAWTDNSPIPPAPPPAAHIVAKAHSDAALPATEIERQSAEAAPDNTIHIDSGFECGTPLSVEAISSTHFKLTLMTPLAGSYVRDWFMFRLTGAAGKTIRFDITGDHIQFGNWWTINPVYTYSQSLDDPATYADGAGAVEGKRAWNGARLPATDGQQWNFTADAWKAPPNVFSFVQKFDQDSAYVAMRIPCPPSFNERFFADLRENPAVKVVEIGRSRGGRPLLMARIGSSDAARQETNPTVVIYAGEHATEPDAMWMAQGAIQYLATDSPAAIQLRDRCNFLIIPMMDPDSTAASRLEGIISGFLVRSRKPETIAYANWFQDWVNAGNRLDVVFDCMNLHSNEGPDVTCATMEGLGERGRASDSLHAMLVRELEKVHFTANPQPWMHGWSPDRLGGWLSQSYGPITLAYLLNSQEAHRHLNLHQTKQLGAVFVQAAGKFLQSTAGEMLRANVDQWRKDRAQRWANYTAKSGPEDAIQAEAERSAIGGGGGAPVENWIP